jgi:hypothetical protein
VSEVDLKKFGYTVVLYQIIELSVLARHRKVNERRRRRQLDQSFRYSRLKARRLFGEVDSDGVAAGEFPAPEPLPVVLSPLSVTDLDADLLSSVAVELVAPVALLVVLSPLPVLVFESPDVVLLLLPVSGLFPEFGLPSAVTVA